MKQIIVVVIGLVILVSVIYGVYWIGKRVSYGLFYEDMVIQTIKDTVKKDALK